MKACRMAEINEEMSPSSPATGISPVFSPSSSQSSEIVGDRGMPPNSSATSISSIFYSSSSQNSENETLSSASGKTTLPYFHLPKPDFEEYLDYLMIKDEFMFKENERKSLTLSSSSYPFDVDVGITELSSKDPDQLQHTHSKCNTEVPRTSTSREYCKAISCVEEVDKLKSCGLKHLALKELLKNQINEKKLAAFNRSKEILNFDEHEVEYDQSVSEEREKNLISRVESDRETSDEDVEEQTVFFPLQHEKSNVVAEDSDESDEDISIFKKKSRRLEISDDDDDGSVLSEITTDFVHDSEGKSFVKNEANFERESNDIPLHQAFDEDSLTGIEKSGSSYSLASEICNSFERDASFAGNNLSSIVPSLPMDDPPILLTENQSAMENIFLSQDLDIVCSGSFNSKADNNKSTSFSHEEKQISEESPVKKEINDFFDLEAEVSGEDEGDDDPDNDEEGVDDLIASDYKLPSNAELRDEIAGLHLKHLIDDDDEILKEYKEKFLDDGELHNDGRTRRFAWKNVGDVNDTTKDYSSSESEDEIRDTSLNVEKAKWRIENENKEKEYTDNFNYSSRHLLKFEILGKSKIVQEEEDSSRKLFCKRQRGSYLLHLDTSDQVFKKLKNEECDGSRVSKHCFFSDDIKANIVKEIPKKSAVYPTFTNKISSYESIFRKM